MMKKIQSEIVTVMFNDIVGYTSKTTKLSRIKFNELHDIFDNISIPIFNKFGGTVVKKIGDAFLITFKSTTDAVLCGVELQNTFQEYNHSKQEIKQINIRVALHNGEVLHRNHDVYGDAVNTAARIEGVAKPGDIVFSESVYSAMNKIEVPSEYIGNRRFKGVKYPVNLFRAKRKLSHRAMLKKRFKKTKRKVKNIFLKLIVLSFLVAIVSIFFYFTKEILFPFS